MIFSFGLSTSAWGFIFSREEAASCQRSLNHVSYSNKEFRVWMKKK